MLSPKTFVDDQKDTILQRSLESLETRYQESKARNQKLLEHLQNREKEFQKELETMRKKLEEQKIGFRNLEDKNLELQYEVNSFKQKEKKYLDQISSLKVIARNYQEKLKTQGYSKNAKAATMTNLGEYDIRDSTSTADSDFQRLSPPNYQNNSPGKKNISGSMIFCMSSPNKEKSSPKRDFRFARSEYIKSLQNLDIENNVLNEDKKTEKNVKGKQVRFEYKRGGTLDEEINEVIMEESASPSPYKKKDNVQNTQGSAEKISAHSIGLKKRSSLLHIEDPEYINKFNKLSENIVSLVIKPEISVEDPKEAIPTTISPVKTFEQDSPDTAKRSVLKYTNKLRKPSLFSAASPQLNQTNSPTIKSRKLFEDFFVIGPCKEELETFVKENPDKLKSNLPVKILISYPTNIAKVNQPPRASIPDFTFPFGSEVRRIRSTPSFGGLNSIIFTSSDYEQRSKCFVFPLLSGYLEGQECIDPVTGEIIQATNPDHLIYIVCITFKDFITMSDVIPEKKSLKHIKYWEVNKALCFMTYYPFTNFFFDVLMKILNLLKVERMVKMSELNPQDLARHESVDMRFTYNFYETIVKKNLKNLLDTPIPSFGSSINFKLIGSFAETAISFSLQEFNLAFTFEASWACTMVFRYINSKDLIWFFTAILLERKLVFLSSNIHLLTATLFVLRSLIKPFNYPFPLIFNLPEVLMVYCDAPGAALIGINKGEEYLKEHDLFEEYPSCIFVCLDEEKLYISPENNLQSVTFNGFERPLMSLYTKLNSNFSRKFTNLKSSMPSVKRESIKITEDAEEKEKSLTVLELFKTTLEKKLLCFIPEKPIHRTTNELDYDEISKVVVGKAKEVDKKFLKEFMKTQIWAYYLEQYYESLKQTLTVLQDK